MYIACPKCDWRPQPSDKWLCKCKHMWHTFDTHGVCPKCSKAWKDTQCLHCHRWSDHDDWYHEDDGITVEDYIENPSVIETPTPTPSQSGS